MVNLHGQFPEYCWNTNKGYGTLEHRKAIEQLGLTPFHRKSFQISSLQMDIPLD